MGGWGVWGDRRDAERRRMEEGEEGGEGREGGMKWGGKEQPGLPDMHQRRRVVQRWTRV